MATARQFKKVMEWKTKARTAFEERAKIYTDSELSTFESYTYNQRFEDTEKKIYDINLVQIMLRRLVAATYFRDPSILVRSMSPEGDRFVPILTRLWNNKIQTLGLKSEMRMAIQDTFNCGWGIMKLGYDSEFAVPAEAKVESESAGLQILPVELRKQNRIAVGSPWWLRVHPGDVAIEYGARNVISARWGVHRYYRHIDDLKADSRLSNTKDLKPDVDLPMNKASMAMAAQGAMQTGIGKLDGIVLIYEIRDLESGKIMLTPANQKDRWLYNDVDEITNLTNRLPFYFIIFNTLSRSPYGCSTVDLLDKPQKEFNDIRTQDAKQRRISIMKIIVRSGLLSAEQMEQLTDEDVGAVIESTGSVSDADLKVFQPHQGMEMQIAAENARRDMRELSGLGRVQMGEQAAGRHTATESAQVQGAHDLMIGYYRDIVSDVILDLIRDAHTLIAGSPALPGFWTDKRWIDLVNAMGQRGMVQFKGSDLKGDYRFEVSVDSGPPPSRMAVKQERAILAQHLGGHPRINQDYLLRWVVQAFDDIDADRLIITEEQFNKASQQTLQAQQQAQTQSEDKQFAQESAAREQEGDQKIALEAVKGAVSQKEPTEGAE